MVEVTNKLSKHCNGTAARFEFSTERLRLPSKTALILVFQRANCKERGQTGQDTSRTFVPFPIRSRKQTSNLRVLFGAPLPPVPFPFLIASLKKVGKVQVSESYVLVVGEV